MKTIIREITKEDGSIIRVERDIDHRRHKICVREFRAVNGVVRPVSGYEVNAKYITELVAAMLSAAQGGDR